MGADPVDVYLRAYAPLVRRAHEQEREHIQQQKPTQTSAKANAMRNPLCHGQALQCAWPSLATAAKADSRLLLEAEAIGRWISVHLMRKQS